MTIRFLKPKNRSSLIARIRVGDGKYFDRSTGIKTDLTFDGESQMYVGTEEGLALNKKIESIRKEMEDKFVLFGRQKDSDGFKYFIDTPNVSISNDLSVKGILTLYQEMLNSGTILSKNNKPLSSTSVSNKSSNINRLMSLSDKVLDFDFSKHNATTMHTGTTQMEWNRFKSGVITELTNKGVQDISIWNLVNTLKGAIRYILKLNNVEASSMVSELNYSYQKKEVKVLSKDQYSFVIDNYESIRKDCVLEGERIALDYWMTSLIVCARIGSMREFTVDNLYDIDGKMYLKYYPNKTKNSSGMLVDVPVPTILRKIFERNINEFGRPLPEVNKDFRGSNYIKRIAKRYDVFNNRVTISISKNGRLEYKQVFAWSVLTMHMGRATGITEYLEKGVPENVVKSISAHTVDSTAFPRYVNIRKKVTEEYLDKIWE